MTATTAIGEATADVSTDGSAAFSDRAWRKQPWHRMTLSLTNKDTPCATLRSFWDMATLSAYLSDLQVAALRVSRGGAPSWWLISIGSQVQAREIAEKMGAEVPSILPPARKVAVLMGSGLSSIQVKRVVSSDHHRHFSSLADAEGWLTEQGMPC